MLKVVIEFAHPQLVLRVVTRTGFDLWDGRWAMGWATVAGGLCSITDRHAFLYTESMTMQTLTQGKKTATPRV